MKCIILAGGYGDRLWPLSRKNFPKQFLNLDGGNSLFQETITRNMPYCDGFYIVTNVAFQEIVEGQMKQFQGVSYEIVLEKMAKGTAPAVAMVSHMLSKDEELLITPADLYIQGDGYADAIYKAKEFSDQGQGVLFGTRAEEPSTIYGYIRYEGNKVLRFIEKPSQSLANRIFSDDDIYWNSGMILCRNAFLRKEFKEHAPSLKKQMERIHIEKAILEQSKNLSVVPLRCNWCDISNFETYENLAQEKLDENVVCSMCENTSVINTTSHQLVVANHLKNVYVINTNDAIYITDKSTEQDIKGIMAQHSMERYMDYFDTTPFVYRPWGTREVVSFDSGYRVRKICIYAGKSMSNHSHTKRNENYSIVKGVLSVELEDEMIEVSAGESINILPNQMHRLFNASDEDVIAIEVDTGEEIDERDMIHKEFDKTIGMFLPNLYKLDPAYKDYLWGGHRLAEIFGDNSPYDVTAESWKLSAHPDGECHISEGMFAGKSFRDFIKEYGNKVCGWKSNTFDQFPILIKFIDATKALSVQVHPFDDYAFVNENEFGKNEVWYVMDAKPDAYLYCGFSRPVTKEEIIERIANNTITEVLNKISVKESDVIFIPAGIIHAIGEGVIICEIQQNSNSTYRLYDYNRTDKDGNFRPLHIEKALDVISTEDYTPSVDGFEYPVQEGCNTIQKLCLCKYFECTKYNVEEECLLYVDESSFVSIVFLKGSAKIICQDEMMDAKAGESIFVSAGRKVLHIEGKCEFIVTNI
ncbi:MAG: cupin domain-containing protein [Agathobacter sp.]|nr:cupin domain-containing protein [Agathobacter sp.]